MTKDATVTKDGGPAFPQPLAECGGGIYEAQEKSPTSGGMTLRDYFAAQALTALVTNTVILKATSREAPERQMALMAYELADAMLAAREAQS